MKSYSITEPRFPQNPEPQALRKTYVDLRKTAISLNMSRGRIKAERDKQLAIVQDQEIKLREFAEQAGLLLKQKSELNTILDSYASTLEGMEAATDELELAMDEFKGGIRNWFNLIGVFSKFLAFMRASKDLPKADTKELTDGTSY